MENKILIIHYPERKQCLSGRRVFNSPYDMINYLANPHDNFVEIRHIYFDDYSPINYDIYEAFSFLRHNAGLECRNPMHTFWPDYIHTFNILWEEASNSGIHNEPWVSE